MYTGYLNLPLTPFLIILLNQEVRLGLGVLYGSDMYSTGSLDLLLAPLLIILLNQEVRLGLSVLYRSVYTGSLYLPLTLLIILLNQEVRLGLCVLYTLQIWVT